MTSRIIIFTAWLSGICLSASGALLRETYTASPNTIIPDADASGVVSTINTDASGLSSVDSVSVFLKTEGGWNGDLYAHLSHDGQLSVLLNRIGRDQTNLDGSSGSGLSVTLTDSAMTDIHTADAEIGIFQPDGRLIYPSDSFTDVQRDALLDEMYQASFTGHWHLFAADMAAGDEASLKEWALSIMGNSDLTATQDLVKEGTHVTEVLGISTHTGSTVVNAGSLIITDTGALGATSGLVLNGGLLEMNGTAPDKINDAAHVLINGGRIRLGGGTEAVGALDVGSAGGIIDFGTVASVFQLDDSSSQLWEGTLHVWNWSGDIAGGGADQLIFGDGSGLGLTLDQIALVRFYSDSGVTLFGNDGRGEINLLTGELVPVPEPGVLGMGVLALVLGVGRHSRKTI